MTHLLARVFSFVERLVDCEDVLAAVEEAMRIGSIGCVLARRPSMGETTRTYDLERRALARVGISVSIRRVA